MSKDVSVLVVIYGCFGRSYEITRTNHEQKIFSVLRQEGIAFQRVYIDNVVNQIDGVDVSEYNFSQDAPDTLIRLNQPELDAAIIDEYTSFENLFSAPYYNDSVRFSALRNSFLESKVAEQLYKMDESVHYTIVFNSDLWFEKDWNLCWQFCDEIVVGDQNPAHGYTNGFYSGPREKVAILLDSFKTLGDLKPIDFEHVSWLRSEKHGITVLKEDFRFLKIRATHDPAYMGMWFVWSRLWKIAPDYFAKAKISFGLRMKYFILKLPADVWRIVFLRVKVLFKQSAKKVMFFRR